MKSSLSIWLSLCALVTSASAREYDFYVGTYTKPEASRGIYHYRLDSDTGSITAGDLAAETTNPSFLAVHPGGKFLYSVGEISDFNGKKGGAVNAYVIGAEGKLTLLNQQTSGGTGPCHISIHPSGRFAFVANYGGGSIEALPIETDGRLGAPSSFVQHVGSGPDSKRQSAPHAHAIYPVGNFVYVCDLGTDHVDIYRFDEKSGQLSAHSPAFAMVPPGAGPRHMAFHDGHAYVINEMGNSVTAFKHDLSAGTLQPLQTISTLPAGFSGSNSTAEIFVHPGGKFLIGSNRGHNSLARIALGSEMLAVDHTDSGGKTPRFFGFDPSGRWLLAAHQDSNNVFEFQVNPDGKLTPTGKELKVGSPVCVVFVP